MGNDREFDKLNCVYEVIHDLYYFGMLNNHVKGDPYINIDYKIDLFIEWMNENLNEIDYWNLFSYLNYLPDGHGRIPKTRKSDTDKVTNNIYDLNTFTHHVKRRMIVPFKYLKCINGIYPLESIYNDSIFENGGTEKLLNSYKKLCEAYKFAEYEYIEGNPDKECELLNHSGYYDAKQKLQVRNEVILLRILCWWDVYGRLTGETTDLNYIDVSSIKSFDFAFSSTSRFLGEMDLEYKNVVFKLLKTTTWRYDISSWNVNKAKSMNGMFRYAQYIPEYIKDWDVSKVTNMSGMFKNTQNIPDISGWDVGNVISMFDMFGSAKNIPDISGWDVRNVTDMRWMFSNVGYIPDISRWKTDKLQATNCMFEHAIITTDLSDWNVSEVVDFSDMFNGAIFKIDTDFSRWNMKKAWCISGMFKYSRGHLWVSEDDDECYGHGIFGMVRSSNIITMDVAAWDVSNVINMNSMFMGSDFSADLSKWDVSKVEYVEYFAAECDCPHTNPKFKDNCFV